MGKPAPLISVGIPTYNNPRGLERVLENLTRQTYKNLEIIVSDNCTDGENGVYVESILRYFSEKDSRVSFYRQPSNILAENFTFLLHKAKAEYFMWAADDDYRESDFIERCLDCLCAGGSISSSFSFFYNTDLLGHRFRKFTLQNFGLKTFSKTFSLCLEHEFMGKANPIYALHKKDRLLVALQHNPISPWQPFADVNIVMDLFFMGGVSIVPKFCFYKTQPIIHPYLQQVDKVTACREPIVTCKENRIYVKRLLLSAVRNRCFVPVFLALCVRILRELFFRLCSFCNRSYKYIKHTPKND